jgi:L-amino acid N-acyltransferase YncA
MLVRLATHDDVETLVAMGAADAAETMPPGAYDEDIWRDTIERSLSEAQPTFFVAERADGAIAGFVEAFLFAYEYRAGLYVGQRVLYVSPENRGSRAAASLVKHLIAWSRRAGAVEVIGGNSNSYNSERTARLLEHLGFQRVGYTLSVPLTEASHVL